MTHAWKRHLPALGAALVVSLAACALLWPMVRAALTPEERFHEWDVPEQYWPDLVYLCGALHDGELPYWNPYDRAGYPYYADPQAGEYHPLNWAICAAAGRSPGPAWAELRVFLGFLVAGGFGLLWLRRYRLPWGAAVLGAVALQAAPFMRHNWELNLTAALAYLPLMLWAAERAAVERRARDGALLALALALCAWVGSPPALWLAATYAGGFWLVRLAGEVLAGRGRRREIVVAGVGAGLVAALLGAGLVLVVLVPGAGLAGHSVQAGRSFESIAEGGLGLDHLAALVAPRPGNHLYMGLVVLALVPFAFFRRAVPLPRVRRGGGQGGGVTRSAKMLGAPVPGGAGVLDTPPPRPMAPVPGGAGVLDTPPPRPSPASDAGEGDRGLPGRWYHLTMAAAGVLMALGASGPLFALAFDWVPGVALFRLPHRYEAWLGPALAALAAAGLAWLSGPGPRAFFARRARVARLAAVALAAAGVVWLSLAGLGGAPLLLLGAALVVAAAPAQRIGPSHLLVGAALSALLLLDLARGLPPDRHTREGPHPCRPETAAAVLSRAPRAGRAERYLDEFAISCRSGTRLGRRDLRGYQDPLLLASQERVLAALREHPRLLEQLNVRYVLTGPHFLHGWRRHYLPSPASLRAIDGVIDRGAGVLELPSTLPAAYWVPLARTARAADRSAALRQIEELAPAAVAILDGAVTPATLAPDRRLRALADAEDLAAGRGELVAARSFALRRDGVRLQIAAPGPGAVVVNETWYPGWRARVDGAEAPVYRANALVRAVLVERGDHRIEMSFRPRDGVALRWVLALAWALCALTLALGARPTRGGAGRAPRPRGP
jgi:hypothetical protein